MTGLDNIISEIIEDAKNSAAQIISNAKKEAEGIISEAEKKAADISKQAETEAEEKSKFIAERNKSASDLERSKRILSEKQRIISDMLEKTLAKLIALPDDQYFELILKLIKDYQTGETGKVAFNDKDMKRLPSDFTEKLKNLSNGKLTLCEDTRKIDSGFVLIYNDIEENCSFKAMFKSRDEELRDLVSKMLF